MSCLDAENTKWEGHRLTDHLLSLPMAHSLMQEAKVVCESVSFQPSMK